MLGQSLSNTTSQFPCDAPKNNYEFNIKIKSPNKSIKSVHYTFKVTDENFNHYYLFYCETINNDESHCFSHAIIKKDLYDKITKKVGKEFFETIFPSTKHKYSSDPDNEMNHMYDSFPIKNNYNKI